MKTVSARDSAFLAEMGIAPLWQLRAPPAVEGDAPATSAEPESEPDIATMDWPTLRAAIASCERCGACRPGAKPVFGAGAEQAAWVVAAGATSADDEAAGLPVAGDAGKLLDNMLAASGHARTRDTYVTSLVKCRPASANGGDRAPTADEVAACRPFLERELALTGAGVLLTLGQVAANAMLDQPLQAPLAAARGKVHVLGSVNVVATLHPSELLARGADKALAWADLCRAMAATRDGAA